MEDLQTAASHLPLALYELDPYIRSFESVVTSCEPIKDGYAVVLEDTAFFPEGGGQPGDWGWLGDVEVYDVHEREGDICHYVREPIAVGEKVRGEIDWEHRFDLMQNHSGEHILSGIVHRHFGYDNVGFHMGDVITVDFNGEMSWDELMLMEAKANEMIFANVPIRVYYPYEEELKDLEFRSKKDLAYPVRIINVEDTDLCACCGTHVRSTGEIGMIKCISLMRHRGGVRIEMVSGRRAYEYFCCLFAENREISNSLSARPLETARAVARLFEERDALKLSAADMTNRYFDEKVAGVKEKEDLLILFEDGLSAQSIRRLCDRLIKEGKAATCAVLTPCEGGYHYVLGSSVCDLREKTPKINQDLSGKGGGSPEMVQGSFAASREEIEKELIRQLS